jgi:cardiolipin synthase A/B
MVIIWTIALIVTIAVLFILFVILDIWLGFRKLKRDSDIGLSPGRLSDVQLFSDGRRFFDALDKDIEKATDHIHISFFIFRVDLIGTEIVDLLITKAQQGVEVRLLLDAIGCLRFPRKVKRKLRDGGVLLAFSAKPYFPFFFYSLNRRNHRKLQIIDGKVAYFGGFNVGDEYLGRKADMGDWRDYHIRVDGQGVYDLQAQFLKDWNESAKTNVDGDRYFPELKEGTHEMKLIGTDGYFLEDLFVDHLSRAQERIFIGSPYFIPTNRLMKTLIKQLERGVKVTLLLPSKKDHPCVRPASYAYFSPLLERGAQIFHFYQGFYHAKVFIVDHVSCYMGTANFDQRSFNWNDEMNGFIYSEKLIREIEEMTMKDLTRSEELTLNDLKKRPLYEKVKTKMSMLLSPLL